MTDAGLDRAAAWFGAQPAMSQRFAAAIRQSLDEVFDGQRTGRYALAQLSKVEKTYIGTKVEIVVQAEFGLSRGGRMDYLVAGEEVDAKWSMRSGGWMIPTEAVGELCLCITADDDRSTFSAGLIRADDSNLSEGRNQDKKRTLTPAALGQMRWLVHEGTLAQNLLLHLDDQRLNAILNPALSGQKRVNELFRQVQGRVVHREVVVTVAQQADGLKRVRDARNHLRPEGILILGHQGTHPEIARSLGLPAPAKGSFISVRVAERPPGAAGSSQIGQRWWSVAERDGPTSPAPSSY